MYQNQANQGPGRTVQCDPPQKIQRFESPALHLEELAKGFHEVNQRLTRVAERLCGAVPESVDKEGTRVGGGSGVVARFEGIAENYDSLMRRLQNTVDRLEQL